MNVNKSIFSRYILLISALLLMASCATRKDIEYLQNAAAYTAQTPEKRYSVRIKPLDKLYVSLFVGGTPLVESFNLLVPSTYDENKQLISTQKQLEYIVTDKGNIELPVVGTIHVEGLTTTELEKIVEDKLRTQFNEQPIVTARLSKYAFTVVGEVKYPGMYYSDVERINVFEALAMAGDLSIYGRRDKVKVIRECPDGTRSIGLIDLGSTNVLDSPYFYIHQNDVVYVEPNKAKARNSDIGDSASYWIRSGSLLISLLSLIFSIVL